MSTLYQQQQIQRETHHKMMIESKDSGQPLPASYQIPIEKLGIQMVDERNKRGRPPKKPKLPEVETREKQLL